jgi:hypothetical protein
MEVIDAPKREYDDAEETRSDSENGKHTVYYLHIHLLFFSHIWCTTEAAIEFAVAKRLTQISL